ncbi:MAG TPA: cytidylate kinase-like family protein [Verrucomicrobiae bacterium]|nr:cytidylate kinase-like family protein [Verrucomicrobiae bacterium]
MTEISQGWVGSDIDTRVSAHVRAWEQIKPLGSKQRLETYPFVAISREYGCEALPLSNHLVETLNERFRPSIPWVSFDRDLLDKLGQQSDLRRTLLETVDERRRDATGKLFDNIMVPDDPDAAAVRGLAEVIRALALHGHSVLVGRGSSLVTQDLKNGLHIRLVAPRSWRIHTIASNRDLPFQEAENIVTQGERQRRHFLETFFVADPQHPFHYDLVIDNSRFNIAQIVEIIFTALGVWFGETLVSA